ncbi:MAG: acyltransferase [Lachnospiraceae bacterium]|nr:acyltransferase [Lachnospiraceae bacterium]
MSKVIVYGAGKTWHYFMRNICAGGIDYICDRRFDREKPDFLGGKKTMTVAELIEFPQPAAVYLCLADLNECAEVKNLLAKNSNLEIHILQLEAFRRLSGNDLRAKGAGEYTDLFHNKLIFDDTVPENLIVSFGGQGSTIRIGSGVVVNKLEIIVGTDAEVCIGDGSSFQDTHIEAAFGDIRVGQNCTFSFGTWLRSHDGHHIYDLQTGERVNYSKNIELGDHIWCGQNAIILKGARVGNESVIGAASVVAGCFPEHVAIGGNPARILREGICWGREATFAFNFESRLEYNDNAYPAIPTAEIMQNQRRQDR